MKVSEMGSRPDVSIVIIVHNDPKNLVLSVESARNQTLRNLEILIVDDCSDDDSYRVAQELAALDDRVRALRTDHNSGGPGAPRNLGFEESRAPWLTFADSDDVLEPEAMEVMLKAAEEDGADIVCGQTRRLHLVDGSWTGWRAKVYRERRHLKSIDEYVDLAIDTMAPAKLYRKAFLLEHGIVFHEGVHYEELLYTALAYKHASSISIIPDHVYVWKVYPRDVRQSITQQRHDECSLEHRLEAWERVEEAVAHPGDEVLRDRLRLKFLQHDARLYLSDFPALTEEQAERVMRRLEPRLRSIPAEVYEKLSLQHRLMYGMALSHCMEGVLEVLDWPSAAGMLPGRSISEHAHVMWKPAEADCPTPAPDSLEHGLLDITDEPILRTPFPVIRYIHTATSIENVGRDRVVVRGFTLDPFGKIVMHAGSAHARAVFDLLDGGFSFDRPVEMHLTADDRLDWEFDVALPQDLPFLADMRFDMSLRVDNGESENSSPVMLRPKGELASLAPRRGIRSWLRHRFVFYETKSGRLRLRSIPAKGRRASVEPFLLGLAERRRMLRSPDEPVEPARGGARGSDTRRSLDLPADRTILLYVQGAGADEAADPESGLNLDVRRWVEELGDRYYLLVRTRDRAKVPRRLAHSCLDISGYDDPSSLYRIAEAMITDDPSAICDYAPLDRPIIIYAPDLERLASAAESLSVDLGETPPGPVCTGQEALHEALRDGLDDAEDRALRAAFRQRYCREERGSGATDAGEAAGRG